MIHTPTDVVLTKVFDGGTLASGTTGGVDTKGFTRAKLVIVATTASGATFDAAVQESNDNGATDAYTNVVGSNIATVNASTSKASRTVSINLDHRKRYLRVIETVVGTVTGSIVLELMNPLSAPVAQDYAPLVV